MLEGKQVGIDAMAFHGPRCYLDMSDLAIARSVEPAKFVHGLGQRSMAVATPCEDAVSLAIGAGKRALDAFDIDPAEIGTLVVGTETGVDHSKPVATYVHEYLGLAHNCRSFETKHACLGGTAGLTAAIDWIAAGRARGRKALVIATDIARYGINTAGEPTQGAGAVAFVVSESPRLLDFDLDVYGDYTRQVMDFWRPLYSKHAFADGHYSITCYLNALAESWRDAGSKPNADNWMPIDGLAACLYHVPFAKMAQKAHHRHWEAQLGQAVSKEQPEQTRRIGSSYDTRTKPYLELNSTVGNIYTGSLFLSLLDYLRQADVSAEGKRLSLFAYGSGCGASLLFARLAAGASRYVHLLDPQAQLDSRRRLSVAEYETIVSAGEHADANDGGELDPAEWQLDSGIYYCGTRNNQRHYASGGSTASQEDRYYVASLIT